MKRRQRRPWTAEELHMLRERYQELGGPALARLLGRPLHQVYRAVERYGLSWQSRVELTPQIARRIRQRVAQGWCNRHIGRLLGVPRSTVRHWRTRLTLPPVASAGLVASCPRCQEQVRSATARQLQTLGLENFGQLRAHVYRQRARAAGWPEDLRPRAVQILDLLWSEGPKTRRQIALALGMPWKGSRKSLTSNDPEGSYLAHLQARGLVIRLGRRYSEGYHYETLYSLSLFAEKGTPHAEGE